MGRGGPNLGKRRDTIEREATGEPDVPIGTGATASGVVKWYQEQRGYGAISCDATAPWDIWFHFSHLETPGFRTAEPGEKVQVDYMRMNQESFRFVAHRVHVIE